MTSIKENIAAGLIGLIALVTVIAVCILALNDKTVPDSLIALGSVAVGALAGVLVPRSTS